MNTVNSSRSFYFAVMDDMFVCGLNRWDDRTQSFVVITEQKH